MASPAPIHCTSRQMFVEEIDKLLVEPMVNPDQYAARANQLICDNATRWGYLGVELREKMGKIGEKISKHKSQIATTVAINVLQIITQPLHATETWGVLLDLCRKKEPLDKFAQAFQIFEVSLNRVPKPYAKGVYLFRASFICFLLRDFKKGERLIDEAVKLIYASKPLTFDKSYSSVIALTRMMIIFYGKYDIPFAPKDIDILLDRIQKNDNFAILNFFSATFFNNEPDWDAMRKRHASFFTMSLDEFGWLEKAPIFSPSNQYQENGENMEILSEYFQGLVEHFNTWFRPLELKFNFPDHLDALNMTESVWLGDCLCFLEQKTYFLQLFVRIAMQMKWEHAELDRELIGTNVALQVLDEAWNTRQPIPALVLDPPPTKEKGAPQLVEKPQTMTPPKLSAADFHAVVEKLPDPGHMDANQMMTCISLNLLVENNRAHLQTLERSLMLKLRLIADKLQKGKETYEAGAKVKEIINSYVKIPYDIWTALCGYFQTERSSKSEKEIDQCLKDYLYGLIHYNIEDEGFYFLKAAYVAFFLKPNPERPLSMNRAFKQINVSLMDRNSRSSYVLLRQLLLVFAHLKLRLSKEEVAPHIVKAPEDTPDEIVSAASKKIEQHRFDNKFWDSLDWTKPNLFDTMKEALDEDFMNAFLSSQNGSEGGSHKPSVLLASECLKAFFVWFDENEKILNLKAGETGPSKLQDLSSQKDQEIRKLRFYFSMKHPLLKSFHQIFAALGHRREDLDQALRLSEKCLRQIEQEVKRREIDRIAKECSVPEKKVPHEAQRKKKKVGKKDMNEKHSPPPPPSPPQRTNSRELPTSHRDGSTAPFQVQSEPKLKKQPEEAKSIKKETQAAPVRSNRQPPKRKNPSSKAPPAKLEASHFPDLKTANPLPPVEQRREIHSPTLTIPSTDVSQEKVTEAAAPVSEVALAVDVAAELSTDVPIKGALHVPSEVPVVSQNHKVLSSEPINTEFKSAINPAPLYQAMEEWSIPRPIYGLFETFEQMGQNALFLTGESLFDLAFGEEPKKWTFVTFCPVAKILERFPQAVGPVNGKETRVKLSLDPCQIELNPHTLKPGMSYKQNLEEIGRRGGYRIDSLFVKLLPDERTILDFKGGLKDLKGSMLELSNPGAKDIFFNHPLWWLKGCRRSARYRFKFSETMQQEAKSLKQALPELLGGVDRAQLQIEYDACVDAFGTDETFLLLKEQGLNELFSSFLPATNNH